MNFRLQILDKLGEEAYVLWDRDVEYDPREYPRPGDSEWSGWPHLISRSVFMVPVEDRETWYDWDGVKWKRMTATLTMTEVRERNYAAGISYLGDLNQSLAAFTRAHMMEPGRSIHRSIEAMEDRIVRSLGIDLPYLYPTYTGVHEFGTSVDRRPARVLASGHDGRQEARRALRAVAKAVVEGRDAAAADGRQAAGKKDRRRRASRSEEARAADRRQRRPARRK